MHLILTGATGLVGSSVLHYVLSLPSTTASAKKITRLSILSRKPQIPLLNHPDRPRDNTYTKIEVIEHKDFGSYPPELMEKLSVDKEGNDENRTSLIWALGISQTETKSKEEYVTVTKTYALEAAKAFSSLSSSPLTFVYISGEGATHSPNMFTPLFGRVKGETELGLLSLMKSNPNLKVYNVRPAGVDGINQPAVWNEALQKDMRKSVMFRTMSAGFLPLLRRGWMADMHSPTEELGRVVTELALSGGGVLEGGKGKGMEGFEGRVLRNSALRRMSETLDF